MRLLILVEHTHQSVTNFFAETFPATLSYFENLISYFLVAPGNLFKWFYLIIGLPFRKQVEIVKKKLINVQCPFQLVKSDIHQLN